MAYGSTLRAILGAGAYTANAVNFNGTNTYLLRGADLTGSANSKIFSASAWIKRYGFVANSIYQDSQEGQFSVDGNGAVQIAMKNASGTEIAVGFTANGAVPLEQWKHVAVMIDLSDTAKRGIFVNGASQSVSWTIYTNDNIDHTRPDHAIGARTSGVFLANADMADVWIDFAQYVDFGNSSVMQKFISGGKPVNLGSDGSEPTGTSPIMFFSGETDSWHTNKGTGGGFTENGTLTTSSTSPSD